jgi:hypothetical protein
VFTKGYSKQFSRQPAPEFGMAMIARLNVTTVMTTVRIAEYKPTRFEVVVDDSVPATDLSSLVISITPSITSSYKTAFSSVRGCGTVRRRLDGLHALVRDHVPHGPVAIAIPARSSPPSRPARARGGRSPKGYLSKVHLALHRDLFDGPPRRGLDLGPIAHTEEQLREPGLSYGFSQP